MTTKFNAVRAQQIADRHDLVLGNRIEGLVKMSGSSSRSLRRQFEREVRLEAKRIAKLRGAK